ncbi:zinc-binding dehydrogenase [Streptomonospora wellingtoniae]|uniref:Alcohol dehydrogenase catalytic domain-containing protein n=1 Tax=Streptomonospora wellingtoniae TaxID=3075544 RepID=A0ABU2KNB7_9ACTN|nr:zinc-binding dehydrogenase [Streptomonospora sp. DSM 45055]MDT0300747.1 alcohol dehydrogenase catalytic domain-containing protein [Streptomonospora sp. DSM 45055]
MNASAPAAVRAAVLEETGADAPYARSRPLRVRELELAPPGPGELLVRIRAAGLCHSDLSVVNGDRPRPVPMVLGHEAAGEVVALGPGAGDRFAAGDHTVLYFVAPCGGCPRCLEGRPALCVRGAAANNAGDLVGGGRRWRDSDGGRPAHHLGVSAFAEYTVVSADSAVRVDADLPFEVAALFGCAVLTGVGAALKAADVRPGERVAVFGLGGVGLSALLGTNVAGAAQVIGIDPVAAKRELAARLGATEQLPGGPDAVEAVRELTGGGADKVVDTTGNADVLAQAYLAARPGGTTVTVGLPHPDRHVSIPAVTLAAQERTLRGSYLGSGVPARDIPAYIALYRRGMLPVTELLSGRLRLDDVNEGFDRLASGEAVRQVVEL